MDASKRVEAGASGQVDATASPRQKPVTPGFADHYKAALNNASPRKPEVPQGGSSTGKTPTPGRTDFNA